MVNGILFTHFFSQGLQAGAYSPVFLLVLQAWASSPIIFNSKQGLQAGASSPVIFSSNFRQMRINFACSYPALGWTCSFPEEFLTQARYFKY